MQHERDHATRLLHALGQLHDHAAGPPQALGQLRVVHVVHMSMIMLQLEGHYMHSVIIMISIGPAACGATSALSAP